MPFNFDLMDGLQVVLEKNSTNELVGILTESDKGFKFEYDLSYLHSAKAIPLGPEMPLTRRVYLSKNLFRPFVERIPSRENPAYPEYCKSAGISVNETNLIVLLSSIASRGPSSFLFKPIYKNLFSSSDLKNFRNELGLTVREFAFCFDFSAPGITRVETGFTDGRDILKRAEIYYFYPVIALDQLRRRSALLHKNKLEYAKKYLLNKISRE